MGDSYSYSDNTAALAVLLVLVPVLLVLAVAAYVVSAFFLMKIFDKAGVQGKWRAWVPFYNTLVLGKLGDTSPWVVLGVLVASAVLGQIPVIGWIVSLASIVVAVMYSWRVGLKLGKDWPWLLLWLIPGLGFFIWLGILAFGSARWNPAIAPAPWASSFLGDKTVWSGIPVQPGQQVAQAGPAGGYAAPGYGQPQAPSYPPAGQPQAPSYPPATGTTPPAPPATGTTPPPPAPPAGPQV